MNEDITYQEALTKAITSEWTIAANGNLPRRIVTKDKIFCEKRVVICFECESPELAELIVREHNLTLKK